MASRRPAASSSPDFKGSTGDRAEDHGQGTIRLLQLSDMHLFAEPDGRLLGQNTRKTFEAVVAQAQTHHWPPDAILFTGDLVHDEQLAGYRWLKGRLAQLAVPCYCIPGNHDRVDLIAGYLDPHAIESLRVIQIGDWDIVLLDSSIPYEEGGYLFPHILTGLDQHLGQQPKRPTLICLHHQPIPMGSEWLDTMMVENRADLMTIVEHHLQVRAIAWGHVHQALTTQRGTIRMLSAPSTCIQFQPGSEEFALDTATPGYRWLELHFDGEIETGIERIDAYPDPLRLTDGGY
jgi:Icc protein